MKALTLIAVLALAIFTVPVLSVAAETESDADRWQFVGELYMWAPAINGEDVAGDDFEITFNDILWRLQPLSGNKQKITSKA